MHEVTRCVRCIQTEDYPGITFDSEGVCSNCRLFERRWPDGHVQKSESDFLEILEKARRKKAKYDAIVGFSGGKDSSYVLHLMVKKYKANVLAISHDNGFISEGARKDIDLMVKALGIEHRYVGLEPKQRTKMYQAIVKNRCSDFCGVCMSGAVAAINLAALRERVPIVVLGTSSKTENVAIPPSLHNVMDFRYLVDSVSPYVRRSELDYFKYCDIPWMAYVMFIKRIKYVMLPDYVEWNEGEITAFLSKEYGWIDYGNGVPHFDCSVIAALDYFGRVRMNTSKMIEALAQKIRCGEITRQGALEVFEKYHPNTEPVEAVDELCRRIEVTRADLKPYLEGDVRDYRDFRGYTRMFQRFSFLFLLAGKLGLLHEDTYRKYNPKNDIVTRAGKK